MPPLKRLGLQYTDIGLIFDNPFVYEDPCLPAGATPRYCADGDPTYPGMLDNRSWSKSARVAMLDDHDHAIARDIQLGRTSLQIRDEIIQKVGMMAAARTPEMQARYDAAVAHESAGPGTRAMIVTITGPHGEDATTIARAVCEMLAEADIDNSMPEEPQNPYNGDSIEQLNNLHRCAGLRVVVQTRLRERDDEPKGDA